jgi:hypothetical protein
LRWITRFKDIKGQLARWLEIIETYNYEIVHRSGIKHSNASHCEKVELKCDNSSTKCDVIRKINRNVSHSNSCINGMSENDIACAQRDDKNLGIIINYLENSDQKPAWRTVCSEHVVVKALWSQWKRLQLREGILFRRWADDTGKRISWQLVVPDCYIKDILMNELT